MNKYAEYKEVYKTLIKQAMNPTIAGALLGLSGGSALGIGSNLYQSKDWNSNLAGQAVLGALIGGTGGMSKEIINKIMPRNNNRGLDVSYKTIEVLKNLNK